MDCISSSFHIAPNQHQKQSTATGTAPVGDSSAGMSPGVRAHPQQSPAPATHHVWMLPSKGTWDIPQRPPRCLDAGAMAAALNVIFEDQMRFLRTRTPPRGFPLFFLLLRFVTDKGGGKPKLFISEALSPPLSLCLHMHIYIDFKLAQKKRT